MTDQMPGGDILQGLLGQRVRVESTTGDARFTDDGKLEAYEYPWVRLRKDGGEVLCFPVYHIRLIKPA